MARDPDNMFQLTAPRLKRKIDTFKKSRVCADREEVRSTAAPFTQDFSAMETT